MHSNRNKRSRKQGEAEGKESRPKRTRYEITEKMEEPAKQAGKRKEERC